ncbi:fimbrial protein [Providencia rettgeri]|nr:fimbrial protein [Providencia rettgeri]MBS0861591.1 fimbrial protein [Providencia rettgeri]MBS0875558.1 fimbrial protein [Providencia rettgeri]MBS0922647.1 fimbrial protein [Providencia rettgeri]
MCRSVRAALLALSLGLPLLVQAVEVQFHGTLIDNPPCDVGGSGPIEVDFGEVGISKIDGENYKQVFQVTFWCEDMNGASVHLVYDGVPANFDTNALQTNRQGLGVRLVYNTTMLPPKSGKTVFIPVGGGGAIIPFSAVPVKADGVTLYEGPFTATATVEMRYP